MATLCESSATFCKTHVRLQSESLCVCISLQYISVQEQKIEPADISLMRVPRTVSYGQRNKVYNSLQYRITEWLVDIQNTGILTGEKLKKKFCSLKLTRPPDEFVIFDTRPQDFIVVSDDLTTANINPCLWLWDAMTLHALQTDVNLSYNAAYSAT